MKIGLIARVKHGELLEAIQRRGWTQGQAAAFLGMHQAKFGDMINLKKFPRITQELEEGLIKLTGKTAEELFPNDFKPEEFMEGKRVLTAIREMSHQELAMAGIRSLPALANKVERDLKAEVAEEIRLAVEQLPDVESFIKEPIWASGRKFTAKTKQLAVLVMIESYELQEAANEVGLKPQAARDQLRHVQQLVRYRVRNRLIEKGISPHWL